MQLLILSYSFYINRSTVLGTDRSQISRCCLLMTFLHCAPMNPSLTFRMSSFIFITGLQICIFVWVSLFHYVLGHVYLPHVSKQCIVSFLGWFRNTLFSIGLAVFRTCGLSLSCTHITSHMISNYSGISITRISKGIQKKFNLRKIRLREIQYS